MDYKKERERLEWRKQELLDLIDSYNDKIHATKHSKKKAESCLEAVEKEIKNLDNQWTRHDSKVDHGYCMAIDEMIECLKKLKEAREDD